MSERLRDALAVMREIIERPGAAPVIYLHPDGESGPFAALVKVEILDPTFYAEWAEGRGMNHEHREGDEDEWGDWLLWRQDDNGVEVVVRAYETEAEAVSAIAPLRAAAHKQSYWVRRRQQLVPLVIPPTLGPDD